LQGRTWTARRSTNWCGERSLGDVDRLAQRAGAAGAATLTSRLLGLARDQVLAAYFGAGDAMDAFLVAFRMPNLLRDLFAEGAMSAAFVPTFTRYLALHGRTRAWRLASNVLNTLLLVTGSLVVIGVLFAGPLVRSLAADFAAIDGKLELTVQLTQVLMPLLTLVAVAAALMGMLNALHHFFVPALAPAMFNIATIVAVSVFAPLVPHVGWPPIFAVAAGALLGGAGQIAVQWAPLWREGFRHRAVFDPSDAGLRRILVLMGPGTLGLAATQVNLFVNTILATALGTGAVSWLGYAFRLMYLPIGLFGVSIATAVLPLAAQGAAVDDRGAVRATVTRGLILMTLLNVPATVGLLVMATPIVRLLFERGQFSAADTTATAAALQAYGLGLVGYSAARIASPVFYAIGRSRTPVVVSVASIAVNLAVSVTLVQVAGFRGLALGTSIAATVNGGLLLMLLHRELAGLDLARLALAVVKVLIASALMGFVAATTSTLAERILPGRGLVVESVRLFGAISIALAALVASVKLLGVAEFDDATLPVIARVRKLLRRRRRGRIRP
jgi:putative peptidoglycan lipid II flippase